MAYQVVTEKVAVTKPGTTEETIVHRGALLPDWVDDFTEFVLSSTGMVKGVSDPDPSLAPPAAMPQPVRLAEHAPQSVEEAEARSASARAEELDQVRSEGGLAEEGSEGRPTVYGGLENPEVIGEEPVDRGVESADGKPRTVDAKERWVDYAVAQRAEGVSEEDARAEAEGKTKAELVAEYK